MFSRPTRSPRTKSSPTKKEETVYDSPLEELSGLIDRIDEIIQTTNNAYMDSIQTPATPPPKTRRQQIVSSLKRLRNKSLSFAEPDEEGTPAAAAPAPAAEPSSSDNALRTPEVASPKVSNGKSYRPKERDAKFIPMSADDEAELIEITRRVAELVVIGERSAASAQEHKQKLEKAAEVQQWGDDITQEEEEVLKMKGRPADTDKYLALFEHFFERNGLSLFVTMVTGAAFALPTKAAEPVAPETTEDGSEPKTNGTETIFRPYNPEEHDYTLVPPLAVATQAVQSVSILVQNVSRATSLYFILSNNHVNELIDFPLELYHVAERKKHCQDSSPLSPRRFASPEIAELTTHFVTFLKSLALRMNVETLQFFLKYPGETSADNANGEECQTASSSHFSHDTPDDLLQEDAPLDEMRTTKKAIAEEKVARPIMVKKVEVSFPLYARALEFCSAHQDSFVRVTAMNICLNTLRLTTVQSSQEEDESNEGGIDPDKGSSPDAVLHNAKPLPLRERLGIAQHVCAPNRVERLVSPIFTKLAQLWGMLEEQFRGVDMPTSSGISPANAKVAKAKETARQQKISVAFNDLAASLQDELLLLEDVLKVGLTSLNEQAIEMMLATFVYPLLLQPLLLYFQRSSIPNEVLSVDPLNEHSGGRAVKPSETAIIENSLVSAPAKSALFSLCGVFRVITNQPLLRLLFAALFHPLSPNATGETMIRAKADVACICPNGKVGIRVDPMDENGRIECPSDRSTYLFGTVTGEKCKPGSQNSVFDGDNDSCAFVLAPALAEVLEYKGDDLAFVARTRHNPYRHAIFKCFTLSHEFSDLRPLSVLAVDSAVSVFDQKFVADMVLGLDFKKFTDDMPVDERKIDSYWARAMSDRGMGGPLASESRQTLGEPVGGWVGFNHMNEVLTAFRSSLMNATPYGNGTWYLEYDSIAAHALLSILRGSKKAMDEAARGVDRRCRQAAAFLADIPESLCDSPAFASSAAFLHDCADENSRLEVRQGMVMDLFFHAHNESGGRAAIEQLLELKPAHCPEGTPGHCVIISREGTFSDLCTRSCAFPIMEFDTDEATLQKSINSATSLLKIDAFSIFLKEIVSNEGRSLRGRKLGGFVLKRDGTCLDTLDQASIYSPISQGLYSALFREVTDPGALQPLPGNNVPLAGHTAIPCVCEASASHACLFAEEGTKVVSEGVTWKSLYLVIFGRYMVLAEPLQRSSGDGRVISSCRLERLTVKKEKTEFHATSAARRLIVSHEGLGSNPPGMFLLDEPTDVDDVGPFLPVRHWRSSVDVWFEDERAVQHAFELLQDAVLTSKGRRGKRIREYLAQGQGSSYSLDAPM